MCDPATDRRAAARADRVGSLIHRVLPQLRTGLDNDAAQEAEGNQPKNNFESHVAHLLAEQAAAIDVRPDEDAVEVAVANSGFIDDLEYVDRNETYAEFRAYVVDKPEVVALVAPEDLPTSFRVETDLPDQVEADVRLLPGDLTVETTSIEADG